MIRPSFIFKPADRRPIAGWLSAFGILVFCSGIPALLQSTAADLGLVVSVWQAQAQGLPPGMGEEEAPPPPPNCKISEFRTLTNYAMESRRAEEALKWLSGPGKDCSIDRLVTIRNNRNQWLGTADSAAIAGAIDGLIEEKAKENPDLVQSLYASPKPPAAPPQ